jgi:hypothetical protein
MDKLARNMRLRRYARLLATCKNAQLVESIDLLLTALTVKPQHRTAAETQGARCDRATPSIRLAGMTSERLGEVRREFNRLACTDCVVHRPADAFTRS